jgi:hypothetical protein
VTAAISKSQDDADEVIRRAKEALGEVAFREKDSRTCRALLRTLSRAVRRREGVLPARAARLLGEAIAAVDGPVLAGLEGDLAGRAAAGADRIVHLARSGAVAAPSSSIAAATATATATTSPGLATGRATLGLLVPAFRVELLVVGAEGELGATLRTGEGTVFVCH